MNKRSFWYWAAGALVVTAAVRTGVATAAVDLSSDRVARPSGPEQINQAQSIITLLSSRRSTISNMLDRARTSERDIIKVNCLNDKLNQADVNLRSAREHLDLLQTAVRVNNEGQRSHEFNLMVIFRSRSETLDTEARQCVGEESAAFGDQQIVSLTVAPNIPRDETDRPPTTNLILDVPPFVSPIR